MRHSVDQRLHYISGPTVYQSIRPALVSGWWEIAGETCVAAYQPKGAASLAASYTNLANPGTYDAAPGTAPTFDTATGWTFAAASNQYLTTGVTPVSTSTIIIRVSTSSTANSMIPMGSSGTNARLWVGPSWTASTHGAGYGSAFNTSGTGRFNTCVMANAAGQLYIDGSASTTLSGTWGTPAAITIGAHQGSSNWYTGDVLAAAIYSTTLDATQVAALSTAMAAL